MDDYSLIAAFLLLTLSFGVITFIWVIPYLLLGYFKITKGKYSYSYTTRYTRFYKRPPFPPCFNESILNHIKDLFHSIDTIKSFSTYEIIHHANIADGTSLNLLKKIKEPIESFSIERENDIELMTFGQHSQFNGIKMQKRYYFMNNQYIIGEEYFEQLNEKQYQFLRNLMLRKYLTAHSNSITIDRFIIKDRDETHLLFHFSDNRLTIFFYTPCQPLFETLRQHIKRSSV
jgi:hypothetical protein